MSASSHDSQPGWRRFLLVWLGQVVSILGSGLTSFALGLWVYQRTGEVTRFSLIMLCTALPPILLAPLAGSLVDRWNRRRVMLFSDMTAGLSTLTIAILLLTGQLALWHIYVSAAVTALCGAFQSPAYLASVPKLVADHHLPRANGMIQLGHAASQILAPLAGAALLGLAGLKAVLLVDGVTFAFAFTTLLVIRLPGERGRSDEATADKAAADKAAADKAIAATTSDTPANTARNTADDTPDHTADRAPVRQPLRQAMGDGLRYLWGNPGLLALLGFLGASNFLTGTIEVLVTPLALSLTSVQMLGFIMTTGGVGMLAGSLLTSIWGGPKRQVRTILGVQALCGLCLLAVGLITWVPLLPVIAFTFFLGVPILGSAITTILQRKVVSTMHGRVFALTAAVTQAAVPLAYVISGPLADRVFEPSMQPGGALAAALGPVLGAGPGRGIALMFALAGILTIALCALAAGYPPLRRLEQHAGDAAAADQPGADAQTHQPH